MNDRISCCHFPKTPTHSLRNLYQIQTPLRHLDWDPNMPYTVTFDWCEESGIPIGDITSSNGLQPMTKEEAAARRAGTYCWSWLFHYSRVYLVLYLLYC